MAGCPEAGRGQQDARRSDARCSEPECGPQAHGVGEEPAERGADHDDSAGAGRWPGFGAVGTTRCGRCARLS